MARPQVAEKGDGLQMGRVNEQSRTADKGLCGLVEREDMYAA
jgi:hypothetical protein